jgi:hypothetical protein
MALIIFSKANCEVIPGHTLFVLRALVSLAQEIMTIVVNTHQCTRCHKSSPCDLDCYYTYIPLPKDP